VTNIQRTLSEQHRPSKELLLQPLPLDIATALGSTNKEFKRTQSSLVAGDSSSSSSGSSSSRASGVQKDIEGKIPARSDNMLPLPAGGLPTGNHPALAAAAFSATPSEAARQLQQLSVADLDFGPSSSGASGSGNGSGSGSGSGNGSGSGCNKGQQQQPDQNVTDYQQLQPWHLRLRGSGGCGSSTIIAKGPAASAASAAQSAHLVVGQLYSWICNAAMTFANQASCRLAVACRAVALRSSANPLKQQLMLKT